MTLIAAGVVLGVAGCDLLPMPDATGIPGQVDVVNHADRPLLVTITFASGGSAWRLAPGQGSIVLRRGQTLAANVELIDPSDCTTYDSAQLSGSSATIVIEQVPGPARDFELRLDPAATLLGPLNTDLFGGCSG
jgi:hypothetical protein